MDRYTDAVNQRDWQVVESLFSRDDGVWDVGGPSMGAFSFYFTGARNVAEGIAKLVGTNNMCCQTNHATVIEVNGDRASARCTVNEVARSINGEVGVNLLGTYYDDIVREADGEWRFKTRSFRFTFIDTRPLIGQVVATFPRKPEA
jgi:hypothetical protein